jgi:hypothetical protein
MKRAFMIKEILKNGPRLRRVFFIDQLIDPEIKKPALRAGFERFFRGLDGPREGSDTIDFQRFNFWVAVDGRGCPKNCYFHTKTYEFKRNSTKIRDELPQKLIVSISPQAGPFFHSNPNSP